MHSPIFSLDAACVKRILSRPAGCTSFCGMRRLATKFLLLMGALAFLASAPVAYAVAPPAMAGQPCPHDHEHMPGSPHQHQHHHDHGAAACLCCCLGACMGIPDLPPRQMAAAVFTASA